MNPKDQHKTGEDAPPQDFENRAEFKTLIETLESSPALEPSHDFTARVMAEIDRRKAPAQIRPRFPLGERVQQILSRLTETASSKDIALCFILAGFFYLVLGFVLYFGLQRLGVQGSVSAWVRMQPYVAFGFAVGLGGLGGLIFWDGQTALRVAQAGSIVYILLSLSNTAFLQVSPDRPFNVYGMLCFAAGSLLLGGFLATTVRKFWRQSFCAVGPCA
jgi:hypothetical protein